MRRMTGPLAATACLAVALSVALPIAGMAAVDNSRGGAPDRVPDAGGTGKTGGPGIAGWAGRPGGASELAWEKCDDPAANKAGVRCADLDVPADWHEPDGQRTAVAVAKLPAQQPDQRLGSLLVNTGGPGPSIPLLYLDDQLHELTKWFDVVAFDPRGIGASSPITCPGAPKYVETMLSPDRQTWETFTAANRDWEKACLQAAGPLAGNLDSWQVAHDMDAIRQALGEDKLRYYGNSYGTVYGQAYAELFPTKMGRLFLDSALNHGEDSALLRSRPGAELIHEKLRRFGEWCETSTDCALGQRNARDVWDELMAQARREPLPAPGAGEGKTVGPDRLRFASLGKVASRAAWPAFSEALAEARAGDASALYVAASDLPPNTTSAYLSWCSDFPFEGDWETTAKLEAELRETAPRIGWLIGRMTNARCAGMEQQGTFPPHRIDPVGLPPALLVSGLQDSTTPPEHGRSISAQLPGSVWFTADADHGVYLHGNSCARQIGHRYLRTGELPDFGTSCPADSESR